LPLLLPPVVPLEDFLPPQGGGQDGKRRHERDHAERPEHL